MIDPARASLNPALSRQAGVGTGKILAVIDRRFIGRLAHTRGIPTALCIRDPL